MSMRELLVSSSSLQLLALLSVGALAGFINVVAGGGSLLSVPLLILLGLPETVANGTSRIAILTQSASALVAFFRAGRMDGALLARLSPPSVLGALLGAYGAAQLADASFRALFGWVMLGCAALLVANPQLGRARQAARAPAGPLWVALAMFAVGVYAGAVQAGVGYLWLFALVLLLGCDLVQANLLKTVLVGICTLPALAVFVWQGKVDLWFGLVLSVGQALGGWFGATESLQRGERFIRAVLALVVVASGLKLIF